MTEQYLQRNINDQEAEGRNNAQSASFFDDFTGSTPSSILDWAQQTSGVGSGIFPNGPAESTSPGVFILSTGTTATGFARLRLGVGPNSFPIKNVASPNFIFTEWGINIPILEDGTDDYLINLGMSRGSSGSEGFAGCFFRYDFPNPNWIAATRSTPPETSIDTGVAVVAGSYFKFRVEFNESVARFFIAEYGQPFQQVALLSGNLPDSTDTIGPQIFIVKQSGTNPRTILLDYALFGYQISGR